MAVNPYHRWFGTSSPKSYYELLGIAEFESDEQVIAAAARFRLEDVADDEPELRARVICARDCLLSPEERRYHDYSILGDMPVAPLVNKVRNSPGGCRLDNRVQQSKAVALSGDLSVGKKLIFTGVVFYSAVAVAMLIMLLNRLH